WRAKRALECGGSTPFSHQLTATIPVISRLAQSEKASATRRACSRLVVSGYRLDLVTTFSLDRSVPTDDQVTSLTGIGSNPRDGAAAFATTHWSVVLTAQGESSAAHEALEKLCRIYWRPIHAFLRGQGFGSEEA